MEDVIQKSEDPPRQGKGKDLLGKGQGRFERTDNNDLQSYRNLICSVISNQNRSYFEQQIRNWGEP